MSSGYHILEITLHEREIMAFYPSIKLFFEIVFLYANKFSRISEAVRLDRLLFSLNLFCPTGNLPLDDKMFYETERIRIWLKLATNR